MLRFLIRRFLFGVLVLFVISFAVFGIFQIIPNDLARRLAGRQANSAQIEAVAQRLHLHDPLFKQFGYFLGRLAHFDLGNSYVNQTSVKSLLASRLPVTASLALVAAVLWLTIGILVGVLAATKPRSLRDRFATVFSLTFYSMPTFVLALLVLYFLFYLPTKSHIDLFPGGQYTPFTQDPLQWLRHLILPGLSIALVTAAGYSRLTRGSLLETLGDDFIRTARAKGLSERRVVYKHALRAAITPIVTIFGIDLGTLLGGAIITEVIFTLPGIGQLAVTSVNNQDIPVIEATVLLATVFIVIANIVVDILYAVLDPRVRLT